MVLANRTPPGSQRSTWVERGHARRLGRRESASAYWFCPSCGRALYAIKKASGFPHVSSVDSCGNRSVFGWLCRTRLGEGQNRPSATSPIPKVLQCGSAELEMASPRAKGSTQALDARLDTSMQRLDASTSPVGVTMIRRIKLDANGSLDGSM